jgi:hypothetical protein
MTTNSYSEHYRRDGVRITHDPYAPGMAEKYGTPGRTDGEGFNPYADSVVLEYTAASSCVIHPIIRLPVKSSSDGRTRTTIHIPARFMQVVDTHSRRLCSRMLRC